LPIIICIFASSFKQNKRKKKMYSLRTFMQSIVGAPPEALPSDELYCTESDLEKTYLTNHMQDTLAAYSYTLVKKGWLSLIYSGRELTLHPGDLYIYSPGFQVTILGGSEDYQSICLIADEYMTLSMPMIWNIVRTAYYPISELGQPVVSLSPEQATLLWSRMQEIIRYQKSSHHFLHESLRTLYTLFILDLRNAMEPSVSSKSEEKIADLFVKFIRLLPRYFNEHHDIGFYADKLNITTTHLSRIVRQITGRTVVDHINQMLLMEASYLLNTTSMSITQIAESLNFADISSFSKFFTRMKGISPHQYRTSWGAKYKVIKRATGNK